MTLRDRRRRLRPGPARRPSHLTALSIGLLAGFAAGWLAGLLRVRTP